MIFNTQLELNITIKDINAIYSTNYETMLLDHAKLLYEGKCRGGQYVRRIIRLVRRSLPNLIRRDLHAKVRVYIVVEAEVVRYDQYDIITGVTVQKVIPAGKIGNVGMLECRSDHIVALMKIYGDEFKVGDVIPIRVGQSMYKIGSTHVLVNGYPFVPYVPERIYVNLSRMTTSSDQYYETMIKPLIDRELKRKNQLDQDRWNQFSKLLHPYKTESTTPDNMVSILDASAFHNGIVSIDSTVNMSELKLSTVVVPPELTATTETPMATLTRLGFRFVKWLEVLNDLTELYGTDAQRNKINHIWQLYEEHKLWLQILTVNRSNATPLLTIYDMGRDMDPKLIKRRISTAIKELDRTDYVDICILIKSNNGSADVISETPRGTFVKLDQLEYSLLQQLDDMINTKLQRIARRI